MKLLITAINSRYSHSNPAIRYLRNAVEPYVSEIEISEYTVNQHYRDVIKDIYLRKPDVIAFSVYIWNVEFIQKLLCDLKKILPLIIIVCGGPEVSFDSKSEKDIFLYSDYIIRGQGEAAFSMLAENKFKYNTKIITLPSSPFDEIPFPYRIKDFKAFTNRFIYYESSRGCPFKCSYCLSSRDDHQLSYKNIDAVKTEIKIISESYNGTVKFVDRTFNASKSHSREVWKYLLTLNDENIYHFEIHPELLDEKDLEILTGFPAEKIRFELGIQSIHEKTLKLINRKSDMLKIEKNIRYLIKETNINVHVDLIAGLPGETLEDISAGVNFILNLHPHQFQLGFLKVLPGTEISEQAKKFGIVSSENPPYTVYKTGTLKFSEIQLLENIEQIIDNFYNSGFYENIFKLLETSGDDWFSILKKFSGFISSSERIETSSGWSKNCMILKDFVNTEYSNVSEYFNDCARFDFFTNFYATDYPDGLSNEFTGITKINMLQKIKNEYDLNIELSNFVKKNEFGKILYYRKEKLNPFVDVPDNVCLLKIRRSSEIVQYSLLL